MPDYEGNSCQPLTFDILAYHCFQIQVRIKELHACDHVSYVTERVKVISLIL